MTGRFIGVGMKFIVAIEKRFKKGEAEITEFKRIDFYKEILNEDLDVCYQEMVDYVASLYQGFQWNKI